MKKILAQFVVAVFLLSSCTNDFEKINTNPNQPESVSSDLLLSSVLTTLANRTANIGWNNGNTVAQLTARINFTGFDRYNWGSESGIWNTYYGILPEIEIIRKNAKKEGSKNASYEGIALIMRSFVYSGLTDNWTNVPFSEAIKGDEKKFTPKYDSQEFIYTEILKDLKKANTLLSEGQKILGGDIWFGGDLNKWKKFSNSLQLRYLLRISKKKDVSAELQSIVNSGIYMRSNADNAVMKYPATSKVDSWPVSTGRIGGFDAHRLSITSEKVLKKFNDNRLKTWYQPTDNPKDDPNLITGMKNGLSEDNASNFNGGAKNVSRLNQALFYDSPNKVKAAVMQYAEVQFILAEAAQKGLISGDAKAYYEEGIKASFSYWGVNQDMEAYLTQSGVAYDNKLETIITQKWLASFLVGLEAWYDYRRTGFPSVIIPGPDNVNSGKVPVRFLYPSSEQTQNGENYKAAVSAIGGDNINSKGWWETN